MDPLAWDGLRLADAVFVHELTDVATPARAGTVASVTVRARRGNDVGIRMDGADAPVVWPSTLAVHLGATDDGGGCWRCNHLAVSTALPPASTALPATSPAPLDGRD